MKFNFLSANSFQVAKVRFFSEKGKGVLNLFSLRFLDILNMIKIVT